MAEIKNYKDWQLEDIIEWCKANGQIAWLKAEAAKKVERKVYPRIASVSKNGKRSWKQDKTQAPVTEYRPISFVELKSNFISTFIDKTPKVEKKSMYDIIAAL